MKHALLPRLGISLYALTCFAASAAGEIAGTEHWVENAGTRIYVWEKVDGALAIHQFSRAAQRGGSGRQDRTILTMRRRPLVNQEVRLRATFLG